MPSKLTLVTIPCLRDNYAYLIHNEASGETALIDAPEAPPILAALAARQWSLSTILITHHHADHIDGIPAIVKATGARVTGCKADAHRLPPLDHAVSPGDRLALCNQPAHIIDVSGHTVGHIAIHLPEASLLFTADSLMAMGCGRLFEGTPAMMWASLQRLAALPDDTVVCSGHEYTAANARFALAIEPDNPALVTRTAEITAARAAGRATVPSLLGAERATNPFLRAHLPAVKAALNLPHVTDAESFAEIRSRKDRF